MKTILLACTALLTGCATPFRPPADAAHVRLARNGSPTVLVEKIWLERHDDRLCVTGYVIRRLGAADTTRTHLDVTAYGAGRNILAQVTTEFAPRQIPRQCRPAGVAEYHAIVEAPMAQIDQIEVRAHDGAHARL